MITKHELALLRAEWVLDQGVIEKDYVLGWLLAGIAQQKTLNRTWVFKGGTCLRKCYYETFRFSEDLDFTIVDGGQRNPTTSRGYSPRSLSGFESNRASSSCSTRNRSNVGRTSGTVQRPRSGSPTEGRTTIRRPFPRLSSTSPLTRFSWPARCFAPLATHRAIRFQCVVS
jgi:hypothetical protein